MGSIKSEQRLARGETGERNREALIDQARSVAL